MGNGTADTTISRRAIADILSGKTNGSRHASFEHSIRFETEQLCGYLPYTSLGLRPVRNSFSGERIDLQPCRFSDRQARRIRRNFVFLTEI